MSDDDEGKISWTMRIGLFLSLLMCVSLFGSCEELRFAMGGRTAQTTVGSIEEERGRYGRTVGYSLLCDVPDPNIEPPITAKVRIGLSEAGNFQPGQKIEIEYIGNDVTNFTSRLKGRHNYLWVVLFFTFLVMLIGAFVWGCIHWNRENAADNRGRRVKRK